MSGPWYAVVTFGAPTASTLSTLGDPSRTGRRVSRGLDECRARAKALRGHVSTVRIVECPSRAAARDADISDAHRVVVSL